MVSLIAALITKEMPNEQKRRVHKKIEAEVELMPAKLAEWKANVKHTAADARMAYLAGERTVD